MIIQFGKHKGKEFDDVPIGYLLWALEEGVFRKRDFADEARRVIGSKLGFVDPSKFEYEKYKQEILQEQVRNARNQNDSLRAEIDEVQFKVDRITETFKDGYKKLAYLIHPDRGGEHEAMVALNNLKDDMNAI